MMNHENFTPFETLLDESVSFHGHMCAGQVIGVRMSMLGLQLLGIEDPKGTDRKKLYVIVEIDRCATDAIQSVTGCRLGKRSMHFKDFGIMAATFVNLETSKAYRILATEESRSLAKKYAPEILDKYRQQLYAYKIMPLEELFIVQEVEVSIPQVDLPGRPLRRVCCDICGEWVQDGRDIEVNGKTLCKSCGGQRYYKELAVNV